MRVQNRPKHENWETQNKDKPEKSGEPSPAQGAANDGVDAPTGKTYNVSAAPSNFKKEGEPSTKPPGNENVHKKMQEQLKTEADKSPEEFHKFINDTFNGGKENTGFISKAEVYKLQQDISNPALGEKNGAWPPEVQLGDTKDFDGAFVGGENGEKGQILLNKNLKPEEMASTYWEELGHAIDKRIRPKGGDAQGDEGAIFAQSLDAKSKGGELATAELDTLLTENDHATISVDGQEMEAEFKTYSKTIDDVTQNTKKSALDRIGEQKWTDAEINAEFTGPAAFEKIWNQSDENKNVNNWINGENLKRNGGSIPGISKGVTAYVGWVLENKKDSPHYEALHNNLFVDGHLKHNSHYLNKISNDNIDGNGKDNPNSGVSVDLLKHVPVDQLVSLNGTRAGTNSVQDAIGKIIANDKQEYLNLHDHFLSGNNARDFLNKFTPSDIAKMDPHLLAAIPYPEMRTANGTRGAAALAKIFGTDQETVGRKLTAGNENPNWENHLGLLLSDPSQEIFNQLIEQMAEEMIFHPDLALAAGIDPTLGNVAEMAGASLAEAEAAGFSEDEDPNAHIFSDSESEDIDFNNIFNHGNGGHEAAMDIDGELPIDEKENRDPNVE